jgi:hypothetical protein
MFPALSDFIQHERKKFPEAQLYRRAAALDEKMRMGDALPREEMFAFLFHDLALAQKDLWNDSDPAFLVQQMIRTVSFPLFPSKRDLGVAGQLLMAEYGRLTGKHPSRAGRRRRRSRGRAHGGVPQNGK